jgi:TetR/AcrR family transcriptional repressor of nem operon
MRSKDPDSPTRTKLLDAAQDLMLAKGFVAATVDEVCAAAGVTKGSFFHYFESKEELAKVLLERFSMAQAQRFCDASAHAADPLDRVYARIDYGIQAATSPQMKGCLVGTLAQEVCETHPELRQICERSFNAVAAAVARDLIEAKKLHAPEASFDAESLGECFVALAQGSMLLIKATGHRAGMAANLRHFRAYLQTLYGR